MYCWLLLHATRVTYYPKLLFLQVILHPTVAILREKT